MHLYLGQKDSTKSAISDTFVTDYARMRTRFSDALRGSIDLLWRCSDMRRLNVATPS